MTCKICGAELLDEDKFCPECGAATEPAATAPAQEIPEVEPAQENVTTTFTPPTPAEPAPAEPIFSAAQPAKKSGGSVFLKIIAILLCLSITIGIAGFFTDWFGFYGPSTKIAKAFTKTFGADSFTIDVDLTYTKETYDSSSKTWETEEETVTGYVQVQMDLDKRELTVYSELEDQDGNLVVLAVYDEYVITYTESDEGDVAYTYQDISDEMDQIFDYYEDAKEEIKTLKRMDWEEILSSDVVEEAFGEDLYDEASEYIDFDNLTKCIKTFNKKINSTRWMKKNAGMSTSHENGMKVYTFNPDIATLATAVLPIFESAFEDSDDYEAIEDAMDEGLDAMQDEIDLQIETKFGIKGGKLAMISIDATEEDSNYYNNITCTLNFKNINKTKIDVDDLDDLLDEAKDFEERN